jgi:hypothetical protein
MQIKTSVLSVLLLFGSNALLAQTKVEVKKAEWSVPFGTVKGTAVLVGDYLVFIDEQQAQSSFAISRSEIQKIASEGQGVNIETRQPFRDRSGERNQFTVRLSEGDTATLMNWSKMTPAPTTTVAAARTPEQTVAPVRNPDQMSFPAGFTQLLGRNSRGRLMVTADMVAYESIDNVQSSRRWQFKDIKEIKLKNPYEIEIEPFVGDKYNLKLEGKGMDTGDFKTIVDRITAARIAP